MASRTLSIGIDIGKVLGVYDGISTYTRMLVRTLMEIDRENRYLLCDLFQPTLDQDLARDRLGEPPPNFELVARGVPAAEELDLFHCPAYMVPPGLQRNLVFTLHDVTFITHPQFHTLHNRLVSLTTTVAAVCAGARCIAVSQHTKDEAVRVLAVPAERIQVIHSAADPAFAPDATVNAAERFGLDRPYVLSVGSLEPRKNLSGLVEAFTSLPGELRDRLALVVAGAAGWLNRDIHQRIERAARDCTIRVLGAVSVDELAGLYAGAEMMVYPSFSEGFGLPVLEAMACGTPVVTSNVSSLPEVAGDAAELVDPDRPADIARAIARIASDDELRADLGRRGLARAGEFSWQRTASRTLELYRAVAGR